MMKQRDLNDNNMDDADQDQTNQVTAKQHLY